LSAFGVALPASQALFLGILQTCLWVACYARCQPWPWILTLSMVEIGVRVDEEFLKQLDAWRKKQDDLPGRPEAIRRLVELGLKAKK
jgi:hypothetical protein